MNIIRFFVLILGSMLISCNEPQEFLEQSAPSGKISLRFRLTDKGEPCYQVFRDGKTVINSSKLGFHLADGTDLLANLRLVSFQEDSADYLWQPPWGEESEIRCNYRGLKVNLEESVRPFRKLSVVFRVFDDGLGFRYHFPSQTGIDSLTITEERTQFALTGDHEIWWIPGDWDSYEHLYQHSRLSEVNALKPTNHGLAYSYIPNNAVHTPVTLKTAEGLYLSIHEAALVDYASMTLRVDTTLLTLESALVKSERLGYAVRRKLPFGTPWRTILLVDKPTDLLTSRLMLNLNEPNQLGDVSYFTPMKYGGIWWEMHLDKSTWDMASGRHGATTANAKRHIDFASKNGLTGVLVEGWNIGWERWFGHPDREGVFDFVTPYPDYDLNEVTRYAREKGMQLIMHHETAGAPRTYDQQLDTAYKLMESLGIHAVKTGYVQQILPEGEHHHSQWMVNHHARVIQQAATHSVAVNVHEPVKPTGLLRTYPNLISAEGVRGQEFNAWSADGGNPPNHLTIVPFARGLAGPIDYTPGIFNLSLKPHKPNNQVNTTLAHQLAAYVIVYSPIQMVPDLPEHYEDHPAFQFIRDVGVDWERSVPLVGEIGEYVAIARKEKATGKWNLGAVTNEHPRELSLPLSFLDEGRTYTATCYLDGSDAHFRDKPEVYIIQKKMVSSDSVLQFRLAPGGGAAVILE